MRFANEGKQSWIHRDVLLALITRGENYADVVRAHNRKDGCGDCRCVNELRAAIGEERDPEGLPF